MDSFASLAEVSELLDRSFAQSQFIADYPHVFQWDRADLCVEERLDGKLRAFCSLYPISWTLKEVTFHAYCIGLVCTDPDFRGKGLAHKVMQKAEGVARERKADFVFLFSDLDKFYAKWGYEKSGKERFVFFGNQLSSDKAGLNAKHLEGQRKNLERMGYASSRAGFYFEEPAKISLELKAKLWQFVVTHALECESQLDFLEFQTLLNIPKMHLIYTEKNGKIVAAGFYGKGNDFSDFLHGTVAADKSELLWLLALMRDTLKGGAFGWVVGPHSAHEMKGFVSMESHGVLCKTLASNKLSQAELHQLFRRQKIYVRSLQSS